MSHMVIYRGTDGSPGYHQTDEVHDAVAFVEQLRNERGVEEARIFRMEQVTFEYRPYFRVELTSSPSLTAPAAKPAVGAAPTPPAEAPAAAPSTPAASASPVVETTEAPASPAVAAPEAPPATPSTDSNGDVGARRGLFGR